MTVAKTVTDHRGPGRDRAPRLDELNDGHRCGARRNPFAAHRKASSAIRDRLDIAGEVVHFWTMNTTHGRPLSDEAILTGAVDTRTARAAIQHDIALIEEARDALPEDSHLRALCTLAAERLNDFVTRPRTIAEELQDIPLRRSA